MDGFEGLRLFEVWLFFLYQSLVNLLDSRLLY